jgi:eukaryotic-like serine/threonine-protein kinase
MERHPSTHAGRYEILGELGHGSMGIVFKARDPQIDRLVAIKTIALLKEDEEDQQEYRQRFFLEARAAGRLSHPGIVTIYDVGEDPDTHSPFIVMEYVNGQPLNKFIASPSKLSLRRALRLAQQLAEALDYAHAQGVVHRDMKPANILVGKDGHAKITDFGIAKLNLANVTHAGHVVGTPAYMSPEQLEGEAVDGRSDLFSLGVILYTMLTGHRPFQGNSAATVCFKVANRNPLPASAFDAALPPELDYVLARAMAKDRSARYQTGREMALDLHSLLRGQAPRSQGDQAPKNAPRITVPVSESTQVAGSPSSRVANDAAPIRQLIAFVRQAPTKRELVAIAALVVAGFIATHKGSLSLANTPSASPPVVAVAAAPTPAPQPAVQAKPVRPRPAAKPATPSSALQVQVEHHLSSAVLRIWSDGHLVCTHTLRGEAKKRLVVFKQMQGLEDQTLRLPVGNHSIRVQVEANGYDQSNMIQANLTYDQPHLLQVRCDKQKLDLSFQ